MLEGQKTMNSIPTRKRQGAHYTQRRNKSQRYMRLADRGRYGGDLEYISPARAIYKDGNSSMAWRGKMKWRIAALAALLVVGCGKQEATYQPTFSERSADEPKLYIV